MNAISYIEVLSVFSLKIYNLEQQLLITEMARE